MNRAALLAKTRAGIKHEHLGRYGGAHESLVGERGTYSKTLPNLSDQKSTIIHIGFATNVPSFC